MSKKYTSISREEFEEFMEPYKARTSIRSEESEIIYRIPLKNDFSIWIYSTISPKVGMSRERGEDAIRMVLMYKNTKAVMKESKTLRTPGWKKNLRSKIRVLTARTTEYRCPWGHALVKRTRKGDKKTFYGCALFPDCRYTYKGEKELSKIYDPKNIPRSAK